jgi:hypothetical protein
MLIQISSPARSRFLLALFCSVQGSDDLSSLSSLAAVGIAWIDLFLYSADSNECFCSWSFLLSVLKAIPTFDSSSSFLRRTLRFGELIQAV